MRKNYLLPLFISLLSTFFLLACGGSSSSSDGVVFQGSLTQGDFTAHKFFKHTAGELIEGVMVCALGQCSTTDADGEWGFVVDSKYHGGEVQFTFNGHSIDSTTNVTIPEVNDNVFIHFQNEENGVAVHHMIVDEGLAEEEEHEHTETEEDHSTHTH